MNKTKLILTISLLILILSGCIGVETEKVLTTNLTEYGRHYMQKITLFPDNTFTLRETSVQYGQWHNVTVNGVYKTEKEKYILTYSFSGTSTVIILTPTVQNQYADQDGGIWV